MASLSKSAFTAPLMPRYAASIDVATLFLSRAWISNVDVPVSLSVSLSLSLRSRLMPL